MSKEQIKQLVKDRTDDDGLTETGITGVRLFQGPKRSPVFLPFMNPASLPL
jgi:hypothetical protein